MIEPNTYNRRQRAIAHFNTRDLQDSCWRNSFDPDLFRRKKKYYSKQLNRDIMCFIGRRTEYKEAPMPKKHLIKLADDLSSDLGTINGFIERHLKEDGFVEVNVDPEDRRSLLITATDKLLDLYVTYNNYYIVSIKLLLIPEIEKFGGFKEITYDDLPDDIKFDAAGLMARSADDKDFRNKE